MNYKQQPEINIINIAHALASVEGMAKRRGLEIGPVPEPVVPTFNSKHQRKKFRNRMHRAIVHPTMRSANAFLRYFGDVRVDYTPKERAIREARKKYVAARKAAADAHKAYLIEKGDFYGGRVRVRVMQEAKAA